MKILNLILRRRSPSLTIPRRICRCAILLAKELEQLPEPDQDLPATSKRHHADLSCSFCGQSEHDVRKLVAGPSAYICDGCVDLCQDIIIAEQNDYPLQQFAQTARSLVIDLKRSPMIPPAISDRASLLAEELERLAAPHV